MSLHRRLRTMLLSSRAGWLEGSWSAYILVVIGNNRFGILFVGCGVMDSITSSCLAGDMNSGDLFRI
jgi:hypothetical protein